MLEIVLLILKIAGIILVSVLGILIVVVCFALFVPVRYRGDFSVSDAENSEKKKVDAALRATWLLRLVRVYVSCEETVRVRVKVLFFTLMDTARERKDKARKKKTGKRTGRREDAAKTGVWDKEEREETGQESGAEQAKAAEENSGTEERMPEADRARREETEGENDTAQGRAAGENAAETVGERAAESGNKTAPGEPQRQDREKDGIISRILQTIRNFCDKLRGIKEKAEKIEALWISDHMINSRNLLGRQLTWLIRHTKPKKLSGYLRFGFDDPSATGYAMAVYGILYPIWSPKLSVEPDFERQILDCHILIKGKIRVWHFVRAALRMFVSRDVRLVIKEFRKL